MIAPSEDPVTVRFMSNQESSKAASTFLTVEDILDDLGISRDTWDKWRARQMCPPARRLPNGSLRIRRTDYMLWLEELEAA